MRVMGHLKATLVAYLRKTASHYNEYTWSSMHW